ncbi:MAG TPA: hypothetical protein DCY07_06805 [Rhodospirillaceae bacterium]|nr:hypothetical protein [Rhodospirillaceae bacterium]
MTAAIYQIPSEDKNVIALRKHLDNGDALSAKQRMLSVCKKTPGYVLMKDSVDVALFIHYTKKADDFSKLEDAAGESFWGMLADSVPQRIEDLSKSSLYSQLRGNVIAFCNGGIVAEAKVHRSMKHEKRAKQLMALAV